MGKKVKGRRVKNVLILLRNREYRCQHSRTSYKILRTLICGGNYSYKKVWEKHSSKRITCEGDRIFFDNFRLVYNHSVFNTENKPNRLYVLPNQPGKKIEDALVSIVNPTDVPLPYAGHRPSLLSVDQKNWLVRYDLITGQVLQEVYLSPRCNFRDIAWNIPQDSVVLRSTHNQNLQQARQAGIQMMVVMHLALFDICPLKFVCMMEITRDIFGKDCVDAMVCQGFLITMHQSGSVRMYSMEMILSQFKQFDAELYEDIGASEGVCGHEPVGLPRNIHITELPAILFEVKCSHHSLDIGGYPWHYLITPHKSKGNFYVHHLETRNIAVNGVLDVGEERLEPDRAIFFGDESGRLLHISGSDVRLLKIVELPNKKSKIETDFCISVAKKIDRKPHKEFTSSGRSVKRRVSHDEVDYFTNVNIHNVDYEDDLDVLFVSSVHQESDEVYGVLGFYDNITGDLLKETRLEEPWQEYYEHRVIVELDTIIQIIKPSQSKFSCFVYKLQNNILDEQRKKSTSKRKTGKTMTLTTR